MRGAEKTHRQDGTIETRHFMIPLEKGDSRVDLKMLTPKDPDEPIAVYYFETGWNYGYPTYHVIIEYGDFEQTEYFFLSLEEFIQKFGVEPVDRPFKDPNQLEIPFT